MLQGKISGSTNHLTSSLVSMLPIPQINIDVKVSLLTGSVVSHNVTDYVLTSDIYSDGKFIIMDMVSPILYIKSLDLLRERQF